VSDLDLVFGALADPTRRGICERLLRGEQTISEVAAPYLKEMSFPAITKHLNVLEQSGLIRRTKSGRSCLICLQPSSLAALSAFLNQFQTEPAGPLERATPSSAADFEIGVND
jgi:DNA-binding transcriptional ArsR family regulator